MYIKSEKEQVINKVVKKEKRIEYLKGDMRVKMRKN